MSDAPPSTPENLAASTFRASIVDRNIAIDFGVARPAGAGEKPGIEVPRRIVLDRAAAARFISALSTCVRDYEARWRIIPPDAHPATVSRAPTPSHAEPDAAAPKAALLFRVMDELRVPHMYERSVRLTEGALAANRFLLSLSKHSVKDDFAQVALRLGERIGMPEAFLEVAKQHVGQARAVHLGFEGDERVLFKYYIEYDTAAQAASRETPDAPATLHLAFKWDTADPEHRIVSRYLLYPALSEAQILDHLSKIYRASGNEQSLDIARSALEVACTRVDAESLQYLEVREDGNDRLSFDLNFYDAGLLVKDLQAPLVQMRQRFAIKPGQFQALYDQIKPQTAGHLAGGVHRNGKDFFNVYYGVQRRQG